MQSKGRSFEREAKSMPKGRERSIRINMVKVGFANADTYIDEMEEKQCSQSWDGSEVSEGDTWALAYTNPRHLNLI